MSARTERLLHIPLPTYLLTSITYSQTSSSLKEEDIYQPLFQDKDEGESNPRLK